MQKALRMLRWLLALATIAVIALLCWQAVDIYCIGAANHTDAGVLLQPIYRWDDVTARLSALSPVLWGYAVFVVMMLALHAFIPLENVRKIPRQSSKCRSNGLEGRRSVSAPQGNAEFICSHKASQGLRIALYALAIIMVVWGVMNGGLRDVLVKAINICTECIGLG